MRPKVLVPYKSDVVDAIQEILGDEAIAVQTDRDVESLLKHPDAVAILSGSVPREYILKAHGLRMIQTFGAGVDKIDRDAVLQRGDIIVCNAHLNAEEVAEYTITLLFALAKNIVVNDRTFRTGDWTYRYGGPRPNIEIRGKKCLIIGLGNIGMQVARRLQAFDVKIIAATRSGTTKFPGIASDVVKFIEIEPLVREADFIILTLPLTNESRGLVSAEFLSWMKPTALLVNVSRGEIVNEEALFTALKEKQIAGAALDVWWIYPQSRDDNRCWPSRFPFHELNNVIISPHRAAYSESIVNDQIVFVAKNVLRFIHGETPENIVDLRRGY
ncbi:MAG: 2-hydroxyacid dehydrogenase [Candidatus Thorarchaeota archaeon]|nr:2-hydroxyacid dehydrogenase [Candidatus Thorarchaeota archaeon]